MLFLPASVPSSVNTSGPQVLTGPKASGLDKQLVRASICCSVQASEVSRRNGTAMLQFKGGGGELQNKVVQSIQASV